MFILKWKFLKPFSCPRWPNKVETDDNCQPKTSQSWLEGMGVAEAGAAWTWNNRCDVVKVK